MVSSPQTAASAASASSTTQRLLSVLWEEVHAVAAALVGGARYGLKIRLPHALVMTALFRRDLTPAQKLRSVARLAAEHAANLASFAAVYKLMLTAMKWTSRHLRNDGDEGTTSTAGEEGLFRAFGRALLSLIGTLQLASWKLCCLNLLFTMNFRDENRCLHHRSSS